jgi:hypothetical protein
MIDRMRPNRERLDHLLVDRAVFGHAQRENRNLESLVADFPNAEPDCFDRIAACVDSASGPDRFARMSDSLQAVLGGQAADYLWANSMGISDATTE